MTDRLRWGVLGTGNIARQFAAGVIASQRGQLAAVGSRSLPAAEAFGQVHRIPACYGSYGALLADRDVEAIYVSLPNSMHHEWTIKALRAGKHVLCEKPFAGTVAQAQEMFGVARQTGRLVMEAFMYRSHPLTHAVLDAVRAGQIGEVRLIRSSFCYRTTKTAGNIRFSPELAGGALMDVGCYCINFSRLIAGCEPTTAYAVAHRHETGVDDLVVGTLQFPNGICATFTCGMSVQADNTASICGDGGYIEIPIPWKPPSTQAVYVIGRSTPPRMDDPNVKPPPPRQTYTVDAGGELYASEADDFAAAVRDGAPLRINEQDTLGNTRILEELRRKL